MANDAQSVYDFLFTVSSGLTMALSPWFSILTTQMFRKDVLATFGGHAATLAGGIDYQQRFRISVVYSSGSSKPRCFELGRM